MTQRIPKDVHTVDVDRSTLSRALWFVLGLVAAGTGLVGVVVPGLPTTPFMILAAACFAKSSQKFYDWIIGNRLFGHHVKNYREGKGVPKKVKPLILGTMWSFVLFAVLVVSPPFVAKSAICASAILGTIVIIRLPSS